MSARDEGSLPDGYPDPEVLGWARIDDFEFAGLHIRMTITPGDKIVQVWELEDGRPVTWIGNVFRVDSEPPILYANYHYEKRLSRSERDVIARTGAKFWKG